MTRMRSTTIGKKRTTTIDDKQVQTNWRWQHHSFASMNTNMYIQFFGQQAVDDILFDVQCLFTSFEKRLSRFDPASELSKLNNAQHEDFRVSPVLLNAMEVALWAAEATGGLYDPTILTNLEKAGYDRSFEKIESAAAFNITPPTASSTPAPSESRRP